MNKPDYELWGIFTRFMVEIAGYAAKQKLDNAAELSEATGELHEKIEEGIQLAKQEVATENVEHRRFIIGTTTYQKLYSELADAVRDLLEVTRAKDGVSIDMMKPLSRLSRLVEGKTEESEEKP